MSLLAPADFANLTTLPDAELQPIIDRAEALIARKLGREVSPGDNVAYAQPAEPLGINNEDLAWLQVRLSDRILLPFGPLTALTTVEVNGIARTDLHVYPWQIGFRDDNIAAGSSVHVVGVSGWADSASLPSEIYEAIVYQTLNLISSKDGQVKSSERLGDWAAGYQNSVDAGGADFIMQLMMSRWARPARGFA